MTDQAAATSNNCRQCAAPLTVEQGQPFVTCRFCGATNFVDKARAVFHYLVRPTVREDGARAALNRWMAGNATVKDLDRKAQVDTVSFQYFPMWLVRAAVGRDERVLLKPAAALSVSELEHQGAEWVSGSNAWLGTTWGTSEDRAAVRDDFDTVAAWAAQHDIPVYLGEFGAYSRAAMDDRVAWTTFVAREAERRGFSWAYWEFDAGFGAYTSGRWNELHSALIP